MLDAAAGSDGTGRSEALPVRADTLIPNPQMDHRHWVQNLEVEIRGFRSPLRARAEGRIKAFRRKVDELQLIQPIHFLV